MFGNLVNNKQLEELIEGNYVTIKPFDSNELKSVHYPLKAKTVLRKSADNSWGRSHSFDENNNPCTLEANEYVVVEINEMITLKEGLIGQFTPASNLIEAGLGITAGRLEFPFGQRGERVRFGIKNLFDSPNEIKPFQKLAHIHFYDIRGLSTNRVEVSVEELAFWVQRISEAKKRHAEDGGSVDYESNVYYTIDKGKKNKDKD